MPITFGGASLPVGEGCREGRGGTSALQRGEPSEPTGAIYRWGHQGSDAELQCLPFPGSLRGSPKTALGPSTPQGLGDERQEPRPLTTLRPPAELPRVSEPNYWALGLQELPELQELQGGVPSLWPLGLHTPSVCATLQVKTAVPKGSPWACWSEQSSPWGQGQSGSQLQLV